MAERQDMVIIGAGPGGYVAAIQAGRMGAKVTLIEKAELGGLCLNWGCIPTKALLASADIIERISQAQEFGVVPAGYSLDLARAMERKDTVVKQLRAGVETLVTNAKATIRRGTGRLLPSGNVLLQPKDGGPAEEIESRSVTIATGSTEARLNIPGIDQEGILTSDDMLLLREVPKSLLVIGGGAVGVEFADMFRRFGSEITLVEMMGNLVPLEDREMGVALRRALERKGIKVLVNSTVSGIEDIDGQKVATVVSNGSEQKVTAEKVLVGVGRWPLTEGLGLEELNITMNRRAIAVNEKMETSRPGIYAIGDVVGGYMLAHVASEEGIVAVKNIMGTPTKVDYHSVPRCIYTSPEIAAVGMTEEQAQETGHKTKIGRAFFRASGKGLASGETEGLVKIISDERYGEVLGVHIVGAHATELIGQAVLAIQMESTAEDLAHQIQAHPSLSETIMEAARRIVPVL